MRVCFCVLQMDATALVLSFVSLSQTLVSPTLCHCGVLDQIWIPFKDCAAIFALLLEAEYQLYLCYCFYWP